MQASRNLGVPNNTNTFRSPLGSPQRTNSPLPGLSSSINAPPPLNLKVMRLSRPSLSHSSQPYLSSSLSAHPTTQAVQADLARSLESAPDDPTFPLSSLLALPGSFGTISLGETFTSSLSLSNDTALPVSYVRLRVELQTQASGSKATLCDVKPIGAEGRIEAGAALTELVVWEIKELGLHNLQCEVSWGIGEEEKSFKKVYKFNVTNPLSVKTKVHLPTTPSTTLSPSLRNIIYLELHLQNTSPLPLHFSRMAFDPVPGLSYKTLHDDLREGSDSGGKPVDPNDVARVGGLMGPGDVRQVCFVIDESEREGGMIDGMKTVWDAGTVLPLGRMDICWESAYGEPGRLQTSVLNRRVPPSSLHTNPSPIKAPFPTSLSRSDSMPGNSSPSSTRRPLPPSQLHQQLSSPMQPTQSLPSTPPPLLPPKGTPLSRSNSSQQAEEPQRDKGDEWLVDLVVEKKSASIVEEKPFAIEAQVMVRRKFGRSEDGRRRWVEVRHATEEGMLHPLGSDRRRFDLEKDEISEGKEEEAGSRKPKTTSRGFEVEYLAFDVGVATLGGLDVWLVTGAKGEDGVERKTGEVLLRSWPSMGDVRVSRG